jgi:hypothetical protein
MPKFAERFEDLAMIDGFFNKPEFVDLCGSADPISGVFRYQFFISHVGVLG